MKNYKNTHQLVILNSIQDLRRLPLQLVNNVRGRSRIKYGMTFLFNHGGFTLIELLVVVLIIGILAAVAVPQYQRAVEKSKATEALTLLKALGKAADIYYLQNGQAPTKFEQLDISLPADWTGTKKIYDNGSEVTDVHSNEEWSVILGNVSPVYDYIMIGRISGKYAGAAFVWHIHAMAGSNEHTRQIVCEEIKKQTLFPYPTTQTSYCETFFNGKKIKEATNVKIYDIGGV